MVLYAYTVVHLPMPRCPVDYLPDG